MAISVRLDPILETRLEAEARRRGVTKSDVIKDALERFFNVTDPYPLLQQVRHAADYATSEPSTVHSENTGESVKAILQGKTSDPSNGRAFFVS